MDKENGVYTCNEIFNLKKEANPIICYNMNVSLGHYVK